MASQYKRSEFILTRKYSLIITQEPRAGIMLPISHKPRTGIGLARRRPKFMDANEKLLFDKLAIILFINPTPVGLLSC